MKLARLTDVDVDAVKQICIQNNINIERNKVAKFIHEEMVYGLFDDEELAVFVKLDFVINLLKAGLTNQVYVTEPIYNLNYDEDSRAEISFIIYTEIETMCKQVGYSEIDIKRLD